MIKVWCLIGIFFVSNYPALSQEPLRVGFLFLPFENETSFHGKWEIAKDVPRFLSAYVKERYRIPTVSSLVTLNYLIEQNLSEESLSDIKFWQALHQRFQIRYLVTGTILEFDVSRFNVGQPNLGGYEAYKGEVTIRFQVYDLSSVQLNGPHMLTKGEVSGEFTDRSLALTLFGKPTERTVEFRDLDKIQFGSEEFNRTVIGQACFQLSENFCVEVETVLPFLRKRAQGLVNPDSLAKLAEGDTLSFRFKFITGFVVFLEGDHVFVNLGSEDGVKKGEVLLVYPHTQELTDSSYKEIGTLQIIEVRGPHLALAQLTTGKGAIKERDRVRVKVVE